MATHDKVFWETLEQEINQIRKNGGSIEEALDRAGVKRHIYDAARKTYGWTKKGKALKSHAKSRRFIELAPVGTGAITVKRNGVEIVLPNADMLPDVLRVLEAL